VVFSVPTGNFGNVLAGFYAKQMGLPVHHFIVATNQNEYFDPLPCRERLFLAANATPSPKLGAGAAFCIASSPRVSTKRRSSCPASVLPWTSKVGLPRRTFGCC
jgi:hypothetical protein